MSGDVRNGLLEAFRRELAADPPAVLTALGPLAAMVGILMAHRFETEWPPPAKVALGAHRYAAALFGYRKEAEAELERLEALQHIGDLCVRDWLGTGDPELVSQELQRALESYVAAVKAAPTDRAPAPEHIGPDICGAPVADGEWCEKTPGHDPPHGRGSRVPGPMVGKARGESGGST